ncbi:hypothetical protein Bca52824_089636 [Brassica carinata]|uniref:Protein phosphatase n=1 Tax=Brassica carinata TaxID=52824 RepID=A0A8X7PG32_BRACI|nr:hypothetical protein Bca52824_089636 [Brassica carinata]
MADPLMVLSLQRPPPFLIFSSSSSSSLHRRWGLSRSGIRFSLSELRLSSQLQLANSTSPSQSSSSSAAPEKLDLVSSTQLKDGSHVFRFGDASEVERNRESEEKARCLELEKKQHAEIAGVKDGHALEDLERVAELEGPKEKSVVKKNRFRSPVKKKKETPSTVNVLGSEDEVEVEAKVDSVSNLSSIVSVAEAIPTSSTEEKTNENVEPLSSEVMEKVSVDEIESVRQMVINNSMRVVWRCKQNQYHLLHNMTHSWMISRKLRREELVSKAFYLESGFASLQNPNKALAGREDAYFISENNWLGVADGVSQWSFEGISEGMYAQELMSNCQKIISDETAEICDDPVHVLHRSANETKSSGSSTALIAHLSNNELHVANIGDSGFMVIRNRTVLQKSSPIFHHFCFPLHITRGDDILKLSEVYHVNLEEGDVVLLATDGLFDNLYEKEIVSIVCRLLEQGLEPQRIAELLAAKAQEVGRSETERTPFADAAKEEGHDGYRGGKLDAVTIIVSLVKTVSS